MTPMTSSATFVEYLPVARTPVSSKASTISESINPIDIFMLRRTNSWTILDLSPPPSSNGVDLART